MHAYAFSSCAATSLITRKQVVQREFLQKHNGERIFYVNQVPFHQWVFQEGGMQNIHTY